MTTQGIFHLLKLNIIGGKSAHPSPFWEISDWELIIIPTSIKGSDPLQKIKTTAVAKERDNHWQVNMYAKNEEDDYCEVQAKSILIRFIK